MLKLILASRWQYSHILETPGSERKFSCFMVSDSFSFCRSGVLKEYLGAQRSTTARRNRTCSDSSVYDTERKIRHICVIC